MRCYNPGMSITEARATMARRGRPRKQGAKRRPDGKTDSRSSADDTRSVVLARRMRDELEGDLTGEKYGSELGKAYISRVIRGYHFEAGEELQRVYHRYVGIQGIPSINPRAMMLGTPSGRILRAEPSTDVTDAAKRRWLEVIDIFEGQRGMLREATRVCIQDLPRQNPFRLREALEILARHWRYIR